MAENMPADDAEAAPEAAQTEEAPKAPPTAADAPTGLSCSKCGGTEFTSGSYTRGEAGILDRGPVETEYFATSCASCGAPGPRLPVLGPRGTTGAQGGQRPHSTSSFAGFSDTRRAARQKKRRPR